MNSLYDLVILGGGCAGQSLLAELRRQGHGATPLKICLVESEERFSSNKTWGFWHDRNNVPSVPICSSFAEWQFSMEGEFVCHQSERWRYSVVEGATFFREAEARLRDDPTVDVRMGCPVTEVRVETDAVRVVTSQGVLTGRYAVDTRSPSSQSVARSRLFQVFLGAEIQIPEGKRREALGLMENMQSDRAGFRFDYVVPLGGGRMLIEATRFSAVQLGPKQLETDLMEALERQVPVGEYELLRKEWGVIPMGLSAPSVPKTDRWVYAGARGGAVRASSGYAFADIQHWARGCAAEILRGRPPVGHPVRSRFLEAMDALFIEVIRSEPHRAPEFFCRIARKVPVDGFVRFMTGKASVLDVLRVIRSLPAGPFLRHLRFPRGTEGVTLNTVDG